jgi:hypothetical protein
MPEGLSVSEVGKEIAHHAHHAPESEDGDDSSSGHHSGRTMTIVEALLLAVVAVLAAYSGFASAKWGTESSLTLAKASTVRNFASRAQLQGLETKNFDASTFNAWFSAYVAGNSAAMTVAEHRFRAQFLVAFNAWIATDPFTNASAPKGPTYMPEYIQPGQAKSDRLDKEADDLYSEGATDGQNADLYVRTTVFLASVLFLVGISGHFRLRTARIGLIGVGGAILVTSVVLLLTTPRPPF